MTSTSDISRLNAIVSLRWLLGLLIFSLCMIQLCLTYRGLNNETAMDMAQVARQIARGEGFTTKCIRPIDVWDFSRKSENGKYTTEKYIKIMCGYTSAENEHKEQKCAANVFALHHAIFGLNGKSDFVYTVGSAAGGDVMKNFVNQIIKNNKYSNI